MPVVAAGAPSQPNVDEITEHSVSLSWEKPKDDGGGKIVGYVVEMKSGDEDWVELNDPPIKETHYKVQHLKEGSDYKFRVKAVNAAGPGATSRPTSNITAEKQPGESDRSRCHCLLCVKQHCTNSQEKYLRK